MLKPLEDHPQWIQDACKTMPGWKIVVDSSGHHRAVIFSYEVRPSEIQVDVADTYSEACERAHRLNEIAWIMEA